MYLLKMKSQILRIELGFEIRILKQDLGGQKLRAPLQQKKIQKIGMHLLSTQHGTFFGRKSIDAVLIKIPKYVHDLLFFKTLFKSCKSCSNDFMNHIIIQSKIVIETVNGQKLKILVQYNYIHKYKKYVHFWLPCGQLRVLQCSICQWLF